jgi:streptomycin 6-kinase
LTKDGWEHVIQFAQILEVHRGVKAVILFAPYHGDQATMKVEEARANRIREEVMRQGVEAEQVAVAREALTQNHDATRDEGLEVVLTNSG